LPRSFRYLHQARKVGVLVVEKPTSDGKREALMGNDAVHHLRPSWHQRKSNIVQSAREDEIADALIEECHKARCKTCW